MLLCIVCQAPTLNVNSLFVYSGIVYCKGETEHYKFFTNDFKKNLIVCESERLCVNDGYYKMLPICSTFCFFMDI